MAKLIASYNLPADPAAFDDYYFNLHVPLAKTIPGLLGYAVSKGDVMGMAGRHGTYLYAILEFALMVAIQAALASPKGQATAGDLANFASAGVDLAMFDSKMV